jgi:glycerol-3-phosphate dehydrogenase
MRYDVAVIGGGVVGCAIARELSRYRLKVVLLESRPDVGWGTTKANSGIIHAGHHGNPATLKGRLEWLGNQRWDALRDDLGFGFKRVGELTIALSPAEVPTLEKLVVQGREKGVPGLEIWDGERARREEPSLSSEVVAALHAPTAGVINPYEAAVLLAESAKRNGVDLRLESPVTALARSDEGWSITTPRGSVQADYVVNATGLQADRVADMAGAGGFRLVARKGEEYLLDKRLAGIVKRIVFPCPTPTSKGILVIPTFDGTVMVGPTAHEQDDRDDRTTSAEGAEEVFRQVRRAVPGISERDCIAEFAGLRAVAEGEDFIIGPTRQPRFINVAGIQSPGLTAAPAIAEMVVEILAGEGLRLEPNDAFEPGLEHPVRFATLSTTEQARVAEADPHYRRVVCRCEVITEAEVRAAIARGATTLDGIKFRTRAGMGRCQGAFCTSRSMQLLAEHLGVPLDQVTKSGPGSWIVTRGGLEEGGEARA